MVAGVRRDESTDRLNSHEQGRSSRQQKSSFSWGVGCCVVGLLLFLFEPVGWLGGFLIVFGGFFLRQAHRIKPDDDEYLEVAHIHAREAGKDFMVTLVRTVNPFAPIWSFLRVMGHAFLVPLHYRTWLALSALAACSAAAVLVWDFTSTRTMVETRGTIVGTQENGVTSGNLVRFETPDGREFEFETALTLKAENEPFTYIRYSPENPDDAELSRGYWMLMLAVSAVAIVTLLISIGLLSVRTAIAYFR